MVLLKLEITGEKINLPTNLHSTMVLLKHKIHTIKEQLRILFTFHYGLIKTKENLIKKAKNNKIYIPLWSY